MAADALDALHRLAAEGALVNVPNAGVAAFDDLLQTRRLLEGKAAERGATRLDNLQRSAMQRLCQQRGNALSRNDHAGYRAVNQEFQVLLFRAAGSPLLFGLIDTRWLKAGPVSNQLVDAPGAVAALNEAHEDLIKALACSDSAGVRRALAKDLFVAGQSLRPQLKDAGRD